MKMRLGLAVVAALGLTACAEKDIMLNASYDTPFGSYTDSDYTAEHADMKGETAGKANWSAAETMTITLRQKEFSPMVVKLKKDQPYVLNIVNNDYETASFRAPDFFAAASVAKLSEAKHEDNFFPAAEKPLLVSFIVPPQSTRTVTLVPMMEGRYSFEDAAPGLYFNQWHVAPWSTAVTNGTYGAIVVD